MSKIRLHINGKEVVANKGKSILEVARENSIEIPSMCHDDKLKLYGSCGLCIVEIEGVAKPLRSCITEARDGMNVFTDSLEIRESRKVILELMLSDHIGDCRPPCVRACPAGTDCQGYVGLIANGQYKESLKLIKEQLPLPASIGRVCPHPCETACRRQLAEEPIAIAWLKRFVADIDLRDQDEFIPEIKPATGKSVAIIGGGPSGLSAAYYLATEGHKVVVYEAMPQLGGMLHYGIPQYRLPNEVLAREVDIIKQMGVQMKTGIRIGKDIKLNELRNNYHAVYVSIGAWHSMKLNCPGEELDGVVGSIEFLTKFSAGTPVGIGKRVAVVGGGNTAMDTCRTAVRLGAEEVYILYRRTKLEMPAKSTEVKEAEEEGVKFKFLVSPIEIMGEDGKANKVRLQKMKLGEPDTRGRRSPIPMEGQEEILEVDTIIAAIGQSVNIEGFEDLELTSKKTIHADENSFSTNIAGVFAGGDATNKGASIAIEAIAEGKKASGIISKYLRGEIVSNNKPYYVTNDDLTQEDFADRDKEHRPVMSYLSPEYRKTNFDEIVAGYNEEDAKKEASRCLECGCHDYFECSLFRLANEYQVEQRKYSGEMHKHGKKPEHPLIIRDPDKCVLCGLCARVCDEVMGISAFGVSNRGFDTMVEPAFGIDLQETNCISCGQCVNMCPTGALQERVSMKKPVPLATTHTPTICGHCSLGCSLDIHTRGDILVKAVPKKEGKVNKGLSCVKGKFGFDIAHNTSRINTPLIRKDGLLKEASWEEALAYLADKIQDLNSLYGNDSTAISVSDRYTNEEIYLVSKLAGEVLNTPNLCSFNRDGEGIETVLGYNASSNSFDDLLETETILLVGTDIIKNHTIAGLKVKKAVENGAKLIVINPFKSQADEWAHKKVEGKNDISFLKELTKALLENPCNAKLEWISGLEALKADLENVNPSFEAREIAKLYGQAKKAMIIFEEKGITTGGAKMLANIALVAGHIGGVGKGILQLKANSNGQGLIDMGVRQGADIIAKKIKENHIKALLIFGEDIGNINLDSLDFLMVQDTHLTQTAKKADLVLPGASFLESRGSFTNSERRIQKLNQVIPSKTGYENWQIIIDLARVLGQEFVYDDIQMIWDEIVEVIREYQNAGQSGEEGFWPSDSEAILYENGFHFADKKARLQVVKNGLLFDKSRNTNNLYNSFINYLNENKIKY